MREAIRRLGRRLARDPGVLPDFVILGAQRAGTTFLWEQLAAHPRVRRSAVKEVRFFDRSWHRGERWYRGRFPRGSDSPGDRDWVTGESTPYYLFHPLVAERAAAILPDHTLLVVLLRHPVDRAWSHYRFARDRRFEHDDFAGALARERARFGQWEADVLAGRDSLEHRRLSYLHRGLYSAQLARWLEHFPAERFLVLRAEDMFDDPVPASRAVLARLGVATGPASRRLPPFTAAPGPPLDPADRAELDAFYSDELARLAAEHGVGWD